MEMAVLERVDLYTKDNRNCIRVWSIWQDGIYLMVEYGTIDGEKIENSIPVPYGLAGRSQEEQMELTRNSKVNSKIDGGYCRSLETARQGHRTNSLGFLKPTLAVKYENVKNVDTNNLFMQFKYDGHRCLITNRGGENIAYSRNGKIIDTIPEIVSDIKIEEGVTIDGELYHHGSPLQTISSWVKKKQDNTNKIQFICYDMISNVSYKERLQYLIDLKFGERSRLARTIRIEDLSLIPFQLKQAKSMGYEGLILRQNDFGYEHGKRSKGLMKVKSWMDDEFKVYDIFASKDGFAKLQCVMNSGKTFSVTCHGTHEYKSEVMQNKEKYIGRKVNVQYANFTNDGIPFQPVATMWRNKGNE